MYWGGFGTRPYNDDNPMHMVWHHDKCIQFDVGNVIGQIPPRQFHQSPQFIQPHLPIHHVAVADRDVTIVGAGSEPAPTTPAGWGIHLFGRVWNPPGRADWVGAIVGAGLEPAYDDGCTYCGRGMLQHAPTTTG
jgi:hypothetical protein